MGGRAGGRAGRKEGGEVRGRERERRECALAGSYLDSRGRLIHGFFLAHDRSHLNILGC